MNNNNCSYTLIIKELACQGYIDARFDKIYTNTPVGTELPVNFGYTVTLVAGTVRNATIRISNPLFIPDINFNILDNSFKEFDLPAECATYRLFIGVKLSTGATTTNVR